MKLKKMLINLLIVSLLFLSAPVYAADKIELKAEPEAALAIEPIIEPMIVTDKGSQLEPQMVDKGLVNPDQPVSSQAPDYKNSIDDIQTYIYENLGETFASLHIDRDDKGRERVILSFVAEVSPSHKEAIKAIADNPELIVFHLVDFTEQQLAEKQKEIDSAWESLKTEGIKIHQTGVNVFINRVEIGIEPYNKDSIAKIHEFFGSEMVEVVEGHEVHLLADGAEPALAPEGAAEESISQDNFALDASATDEKIGFFQRIALFFKAIFSRIVN